MDFAGHAHLHQLARTKKMMAIKAELDKKGEGKGKEAPRFS
jgi:hypothetical protein